MSALLGLLMLGLLLLSLWVGGTLTPAQVGRALLGQGEPLAQIVLFELRLPRALLALLVGAALATAGGVMQGMARNALASPDLTGVVAGAACLIVLSITLGSVDTQWLPLLGFAGGLGAGGLSFVLAWNGRLQPVRVVLAGVAVSSVCVAVMTGMLVFSGAEASELFFWLAGGLAGRGWEPLAHSALWMLLPLLLIFICSARYRVLLLDDAVAQTLGVAVVRWKLGFLLLTAVMTAAAVVVAGPVGFVGLVVPHITRKLLSEQQPGWLPLNAVLGALLLLLADLLARAAPGAQEIPLGVVTALLGGPWLLSLVARSPKAVA